VGVGEVRPITAGYYRNPAYFFSASNPDAGVFRAQGNPVGPEGLYFPTARGDGFFYVANSNGLWAFDDRPAGATTVQPFSQLGATPFSGLVAHPSGILVAIPDQLRSFGLFVPDGGVVPPGEVLRSPWFNKL
jgi:hypothetical protein